jgi:histidine triad (HIT) family protein
MNPDNKSCVFCAIVRRTEPALVVYETDTVICFLPPENKVWGHTLVIPKPHFENLYDIPNQLLNEVVEVCQYLTLKYRENLNATGMNVLHASGIDGQQSVQHFHFHLYPRFKGDGLNTSPKLPEQDFDKQEMLVKLRAAAQK